MPGSTASHNQKSHVAPHFDHLDLMNAMVLFTMPSAWHDVDTSVNCISWSMLHLVLIILTLQMQWSCWQCHWYHLTPMLMWSKSHAALCFNCLDLTKAMVLLTTLSMSCVGNADVNGTALQNSSCCTSLQLSWPYECSDAIDNAIGITWWQCWYEWYHMMKEVMLHLIWIILCNECNQTIDDAVSITDTNAGVSGVTWP